MLLVTIFRLTTIDEMVAQQQAQVPVPQWYYRLSPRNSVGLPLVEAVRGVGTLVPGGRGADWTSGRPRGKGGWRVACGVRSGIAPPPSSLPATLRCASTWLWPARLSSIVHPPSSLRMLRLALACQTRVSQFVLCNEARSRTPGMAGHGARELAGTSQ